MSVNHVETAETLSVDSARSKKSAPVNLVTVRVSADGVSPKDKTEILRYLSTQRCMERDGGRVCQDVDAINKIADSLLRVKDGHVEAEYRVSNKMVDLQSYADVSAAFGSTPVVLEVYKAGDDVEVSKDRTDPAYWNYIRAAMREGQIESVSVGHLQAGTASPVSVFEVQPDACHDFQSVLCEVNRHIDFELEQGVDQSVDLPSDPRLKDAQKLDASLQCGDKEDETLYSRRFG